MPRRIHIPLLAILLVFVQIAKGQDIPALLAQIKDGHEDSRTLACSILGDMGPEAKAAVPELIADLGDQHGSGRDYVARALLRIAPTDPAVIAAITSALHDPSSPTFRGSVARSLEGAFPCPTWAIPTLAGLLKEKDSWVAEGAADVLGKMGPDAVAAAPALLELTHSKDKNTCFVAYAALARMGPAAKPIVPALVTMLASADQEERGWAVDMLLKLAPLVADEAVPVLIRTLQDVEPRIRLDAAFALGRTGYKDTAALPAFAPPLKDEDRSLRVAFAMGAAGATDPGGRESILKLLQAASDSEVRLRLISGEAVERLGEPAMPVLTDLLRSPDFNIRSAAAFGLSRIGRQSGARHCPAAPAAVRALLVTLNDSDPQVRGMAGSALMAYHSTDAVPALLDALKSDLWDVRGGAAMALGETRGDARLKGPIIIALTALLKDDNHFVRMVAVQGLGKFGPAARETVPMLADALNPLEPQKITVSFPRKLTDEEKTQVETLRKWAGSAQTSDDAARALGRIGPEARVAVPELMKHVKMDGHISREPVQALGDIGPDAAAAIPTLVPLLNDPTVGYVVCTAIAKMGEPGAAALVLSLHDEELRSMVTLELGRSGRAAVPSLIRALSDPDNEVRASAVRALGENGPRATDAIPVLMEMAKDTDSIVRLLAADALGKIGPAKAP